MKVLKSRLVFFFVFLLILNSKLSCGIIVKPFPETISFSRNVLLQGLELTKKILDCTISYYHQRCNMAILDLNFRYSDSDSDSLKDCKWENGYDKELRKLELFFYEKKNSIGNLLILIDQNISKVKKHRIHGIEEVFCLLIMILSNILKDLPDFSLDGYEEILDNYSFNVICSSDKDLIVDYDPCCEIIDLLFLLNEVFLIKQLSFAEQIKLSRSYDEFFLGKKFFQRGIIII